MCDQNSYGGVDRALSEHCDVTERSASGVGLLAIISQTETCRSQCYQRFAFVDQLRGRRTSFKIVLDLRQEPLEPVRLGFVGQYLGL